MDASVSIVWVADFTFRYTRDIFGLLLQLPELSFDFCPGCDMSSFLVLDYAWDLLMGIWMLTSLEGGVFHHQIYLLLPSALLDISFLCLVFGYSVFLLFLPFSYIDYPPYIPTVLCVTWVEELLIGSFG